MFRNLFRSSSLTERRAEQEHYIAIVAQARRKWFYREGGVPDTLDGRFDLLLLHLALVLHQWQKRGEAPERSRLLMEAFFEDMDRSVRELGVSDTGVGRRVRQMAEAFYGRLAAYTEAFGEEAPLRKALHRNLYQHKEPTEHALTALVGYITACLVILEESAAPGFVWPDVACVQVA